jgi:hypothetical protein
MCSVSWDDCVDSDSCRLKLALIDRLHDGNMFLYLKCRGKTNDQSEGKKTEKCV